MHDTPRLRRLRNDFSALEKLRAESSVLRFRASGRPAQHYVVEFRGRSLARHRGQVMIHERHEVEIKLGASYPRSMPELRWLTPIFHPNISEIGMVCLGGYGTHWVPSLNLDELVGMLWDMARYHNYDVRSPYNRDAALWVANQAAFAFPLDPRPLRDIRARLGRIEPHPHHAPSLADGIADGNGQAPVEFIPVEDEPSEGTPETSSPPTAVAVVASPAATEPVSTDPGGTAGDEEDLVILEPVDEPPTPVQAPTRPVPPPVPVRLRAQDEEILFIE